MSLPSRFVIDRNSLTQFIDGIRSPTVVPVVPMWAENEEPFAIAISHDAVSVTLETFIQCFFGPPIRV